MRRQICDYSIYSRTVFYNATISLSSWHCAAHVGYDEQIGIISLRCLIGLTVAIARDAKVYELVHVVVMQVRKNVVMKSAYREDNTSRSRDY